MKHSEKQTMQKKLVHTVVITSCISLAKEENCTWSGICRGIWLVLTGCSIGCTHKRRQYKCHNVVANLILRIIPSKVLHSSISTVTSPGDKELLLKVYFSSSWRHYQTSAYLFLETKVGAQEGERYRNPKPANNKPRWETLSEGQRNADGFQQ